MSYTSSLTNGYASLFSGLGFFSVSPYTATFLGVAAGSDDGLGLNGVVSGFITCAVLTAIPVLPLCTLITMSLAIAAAFIAVFSAFPCYTVALALDAASDCGSNNFSSVEVN